MMGPWTMRVANDGLTDNGSAVNGALSICPWTIGPQTMGIANNGVAGNDFADDGAEDNTWRYKCVLLTMRPATMGISDNTYHLQRGHG